MLSSFLFARVKAVPPCLCALAFTDCPGVERQKRQDVTQGYGADNKAERSLAMVKQKTWCGHSDISEEPHSSFGQLEPWIADGVCGSFKRGNMRWASVVNFAGCGLPTTPCDALGFRYDGTSMLAYPFPRFPG